MEKDFYSDRDLQKMYEEMLNDCFGTVKLGGYEYEHADAFKSTDPTAYRIGFADYISSLLDEEFEELPDGSGYIRKAI